MARVEIAHAEKELIVKELTIKVDLCEEAETPATGRVEHVAGVLARIVPARTGNGQEAVAVQTARVHPTTEERQVSAREIDSGSAKTGFRDQAIPEGG